jgi:cysteinyl-tRNA synthetase
MLKKLSLENKNKIINSEGNEDNFISLSQVEDQFNLYENKIKVLYEELRNKEKYSLVTEHKYEMINEENKLLNEIEIIKAGRDQANNKITNDISIQKEMADKIRNDFNVVQLSLNQVDVLNDLSSSSKEVYESFVRQFPTGRKTWVEVLNARKEATQARISLSDAQWNGLAASLRTKIATGEIFGFINADDYFLKDACHFLIL